MYLRILDPKTQVGFFGKDISQEKSASYATLSEKEGDQKTLCVIALISGSQTHKNTAQQAASKAKQIGTQRKFIA